MKNPDAPAATDHGMVSDGQQKADCTLCDQKAVYQTRRSANQREPRRWILERARGHCHGPEYFGFRAYQRIDKERKSGSLSSTIRLFVLHQYRRDESDGES